MAFDPDLGPIFGAIEERLCAVEVKPDPSPALALRLDALEAAPVVPDLTAPVAALKARVASLRPPRILRTSAGRWTPWRHALRRWS